VNFVFGEDYVGTLKITLLHEWKNMCEVVHVLIGNQFLKQWMQQHPMLHHGSIYVHYDVIYISTNGCLVRQWGVSTFNEEGLWMTDGEALVEFQVYWKILLIVVEIMGWSVKLWAMLLSLSCNTNGNKVFNEPWTFFQKNVGKGMFQCTYITNLAFHNLVMEIAQKN